MTIGYNAQRRISHGTALVNKARELLNANYISTCEYGG